MKINLADFIKKTGAQVALTEAERMKMRGVISEYVAMKPIRSADVNRTPAGTVHAWYFLMRKPVALALVAVLLVSVSGAGISYAAEGALPGDVLYPIKVGVNEPVETALAVTPEAKAAVAVRHAVARLNEASALAAKGKLTSATEEKLAAAFETQADVASQHVSDLESKDSPAAIAVASDVESELAAHVQVLDEVDHYAARTLRAAALSKARVFSGIRTSAEHANDVSASGPEVAVATTFAKAAAPAPMMALRAEFSASTSDDSGTQTPAPAGAGKEAASRMGSAAHEALSDTQTLFLKLSAKLSADDALQATTTLASAGAEVAAGDEVFNTADYVTAFHDYQDAFVSLKKLDVFMRTSVRDGLRFRSDPVPVRAVVNTASVPSVSGGSSEGGSSSSHDAVPPPSLQIFPDDGN